MAFWSTGDSRAGYVESARWLVGYIFPGTGWYRNVAGASPASTHCCRQLLLLGRDQYAAPPFFAKVMYGEAFCLPNHPLSAPTHGLSVVWEKPLRVHEHLTNVGFPQKS